MEGNAISDFFIRASDFIDGLNPVLQILGLLIAGMIPFIEGYGASFIGIIVGLHPFVVVPVAIIGNLAIVYALTMLAGSTRSAVMKGKEPVKRTEKQQKLAKWTDRLGVPRACLVSTLAVPSMLAGPLFVGLGARKVTVMIWMTVGVVLWAIATGLLGEGLLTLLG